MAIFRYQNALDVALSGIQSPKMIQLQVNEKLKGTTQLDLSIQEHMCGKKYTVVTNQEIWAKSFQDQSLDPAKAWLKSVAFGIGETAWFSSSSPSLQKLNNPSGAISRTGTEMGPDSWPSGIIRSGALQN